MLLSHATARKTSVFTLIELLVVIAIIAILAAILFFVFAQAREKAMQAACISNSKQYVLGILQYVQDADECMPLTFQDSYMYGPCASKVTGTPQIGVPVQTMPYVKSVQVFVCPSDAGINAAFLAGSNLPAPMTATQAIDHTIAEVYGASYKYTNQTYSKFPSSVPNGVGGNNTGYSQVTNNCSAGGTLDSVTVKYTPNDGKSCNKSGADVISIGMFTRPAETRVFGDWQKPFGKYNTGQFDIFSEIFNTVLT